jgi:hypothetical protein
MGTALTLVAMVGAITSVGCRQRSEAEVHRAALANLEYEPPPQSLGDRFSLAYLCWNLQGRPRNKDVMVKQAQHMEALVALGELERRTFLLEHEKFDVDGMGRFTALVQKAYATNGHQERLVKYYSDNQDLRTITVITSPVEMKTWQGLVRSFDNAAALPNLQGRVNEKQPFSPDMNQP